MKWYKLCLCAPLLPLLLTSCIRDEALNPECDITNIDAAWLQMAYDKGYVKGTPRVENQRIVFTLGHAGVDSREFAPRFVLSTNASIKPANGTKRDFTTPQTYTVYAQDRIWHKDYTVSFEQRTISNLYSFEHAVVNTQEKQNYYTFYEETGDGTRSKIWVSANPGFQFTGLGKSPEHFPTVSIEEGLKGRGVLLQTLSTGGFGALMNMPIAAGSLFIGDFDTPNAAVAPLQSTRFGLPILHHRPLSVKGFYKYTPGAKVQDRSSKIRPNETDSCDVYAVVYEVDPLHFEPLNGTNVLSSDRVVLVARTSYMAPTEAWTQFVIPFSLRPGKSFDYDRLANEGYAITIVCTSSRDGGNFVGAVGSKLYIDEIELTSETN